MLRFLIKLIFLYFIWLLGENLQQILILRCLATVSGYLLPAAHYLPRQFLTLRHLREFGALFLRHLRYSPRCLLLHQQLHLTLPHRELLIKICGCIHMHHTQDIQWMICLPSMDGRVWIFWTPIDRRVLIGKYILLFNLKI